MKKQRIQRISLFDIVYDPFVKRSTTKINEKNLKNIVIKTITNSSKTNKNNDNHDKPDADVYSAQYLECNRKMLMKQSIKYRMNTKEKWESVTTKTHK